MGYTCPVCSDPQADAGHLANHLAFTAMTGGDDHEVWLDDHVDDWGELGEAELAEIVVNYADEEEFPQVFEESGLDDDHDHDGVEDLPPGAEQSRSRTMSDADESVLAEARELTKEMLEESEAEADSESGAEDETE